MQKIFSFLKSLFLVLIFVASLIFAKTSLAADLKIIRVATQQDIEPFIFPKTNSGLLLEIINGALAQEGLQAEYSYLPNIRLNTAISKDQFDIVTLSNPDWAPEGIYSRYPIITFHNQAITFKKKLQLKSIADLAHLRVLAFQSASKYLGSEYAAMAAKNPDYKESNRMPALMLPLDRIDVAVSQPDIFIYNLYNIKIGEGSFEGVQSFSFYDLFGPGTKYWFRFRSTKLRDQFENGLKSFYMSKKADQLLEKYQKEYGTSKDFFSELECRFKNLSCKSDGSK